MSIGERVVGRKNERFRFRFGGYDPREPKEGSAIPLSTLLEREPFSPVKQAATVHTRFH